MEMRTFTVCGGVPIEIWNEDQGPSLPSNSKLGGMEIGAGNCVSARLPSPLLCITLLIPKRRDGGAHALSELLSSCEKPRE